MDGVNLRISQIIDTLFGGNKSAFARQVGITPAYAAQMYAGQRIPSDRTIGDISRECKVSLDWLRDGTGEMQPSQTVGDEVGQIVADALKGQPEETREYFHRLLDGLTGAEILLMGEVLRRYLDRRDQERQTRDKQETDSPQE